MIFPVVWGWPQILLLLLAVAGVLLLLFAILSLIKWKLRWRSATTGLVMLLVALLLLSVSFFVQTYLGLTGDVLVAKVRAYTVVNSGAVPEMFVDQNSL